MQAAVAAADCLAAPAAAEWRARGAFGSRLVLLLCEGMLLRHGKAGDKLEAAVRYMNRVSTTPGRLPDVLAGCLAALFTAADLCGCACCYRCEAAEGAAPHVLQPPFGQHSPAMRMHACSCAARAVTHQGRRARTDTRPRCACCLSRACAVSLRC
jgi:hypothetical protein